MTSIPPSAMLPPAWAGRLVRHATQPPRYPPVLREDPSDAEVALLLIRARLAADTLRSQLIDVPLPHRISHRRRSRRRLALKLVRLIDESAAAVACRSRDPMDVLFNRLIEEPFYLGELVRDARLLMEVPRASRRWQLWRML